ncbi:MAG: hypothetical protein IJ233_02090, partial [Pyramidobacter sp.]|nr:hypothetical protein [Pyramidobacter sp.]
HALRFPLILLARRVTHADPPHHKILPYFSLHFGLYTEFGTLLALEQSEAYADAGQQEPVRAFG